MSPLDIFNSHFDDYQAQAASFAEYTGSLYPVLGLAEEAGEVVSLFSKLTRGDYFQVDPEKLEKELGDVLWMIANICEEEGLKLSQVAQNNIHKLILRKQKGNIKGTGSDR